MEMTRKPIPWMSLREKGWLYRAEMRSITGGAPALVLQAEWFWATAARPGGISPADLAVFHLSPAVWLIRDLVQARVWEVT